MSKEAIDNKYAYPDIDDKLTIEKINNEFGNEYWYQSEKRILNLIRDVIEDFFKDKDSMKLKRLLKLKDILMLK